MALTKISTAMWNSVPHHDTHDFNVDDVLYVDVSANSVGIGTTNPTNGKLQIDSNTNQISIETGTAGDGRLHIGHFTNGTFIGTYGDDGGVADIIRFGTHSGDERMRITSGGFVGINETNPSERLDINGAIKSTSNAANFQTESQLTLDYYDAIGAGRIAAYKSTGSILQFITNASGGNTTERMRIDSSGNVGIGTTNPSGKFHVDHGDAYNMGVLHEYVSTYVTRTKFGRPGTVSNLELYYDIAGAEIAKITRNYSQAQLQFVRGGTVDMIINGTGNVGIGTTNPSADLEVFTDAGGGNTLRLNTNFGGGNSVDINPYISGVNNGGMEIKLAGSQKLVMNPSGNVGIGTTSPDDKLHVQGNITLTDGSPEITFETGATHYNWQLAAQENVNAAFDISVGSADGDASNDTFTNVFTVYQASSGYTLSSGSSRAPIFYDSNNTTYYGDFAGRSIMDSLQLGNASSDTTNLKLDVQGNMAIRGTNGLYYGVTTNNYGSWTTRMYASGSTQYFNGQEFRFDNQGYGSTTFGVINASGIHDQRSNTYAALRHSGSDFANGTLVATDIPSSASSGASFIIEVTGKSYSTTPPFSFIAQGYLYADTIINTSGVNNGDLRLTYIKVMNYNGYLHFWWPRVSYWNSFEVRVRDAGGDVTNRVTSIGNSAEPSGATKVIQINLHQSVTYDTNTNSGALYATTFYDSNDTNYYVDPTSTGAISSIKTAGGGQIGTSLAHKLTVAGNGNYMNINFDQIWNAGGNLHLQYSSGYNVDMCAGGGYAWSRTSLRAPIFYDSDNTSYYVDPHSSGTSISVRGVIQNPSIWINDGDNYNGYDENIRLFNPPNGVSTIAFSASGTSGTPTTSILGFSDRFETRIGSTWRTRLYGGYLEVNGHANATLFYDSNNTGYYVDPASTSNLNTTSSDLFTAGQLRFKGVGGNSGQTAYDYAIYQAAGAWSYPYPDLIVGWHTGIRIGAYWNYGGIRFYNNSPESAGATEIFSVGNGDDHVRVANYLYAPVVYDTNNTGYYTDPASTSRTNRIISNLLDVTAGAAYAVRFWGGSDIYSIRMSETGNSTYGGRVAGETTSDYNMYFTMAGGTNRGFVFRNANSSSSAVAGIDASGNGRFIGDVVAYSSSDERLKDNQKNIDNALEKVESLNGIEFDWNDKQDTFTGHDVGVIAQEVEKVLPEIVNTRDTGYKAVKYEKLVPLLIEAIKELSEKVKILENK